MVAVTAWSIPIAAQEAPKAGREDATATEPPSKPEVPPGATDEALLDLAEEPASSAAPYAYPAASAPPAPGYAPPPPVVTLSPRAPRGGAAPTEDEPPRRSIGMMVTGIVLTSVGAVAALTGAAIAGDAENCEGEACRRFGAHGYGVGLGVGGLAVIGAGIPLLVVGAQRVDPDEPAIALTIRPGGFTLRTDF